MAPSPNLVSLSNDGKLNVHANFETFASGQLSFLG